jgi:hypothetical protein
MEKGWKAIQGGTVIRTEADKEGKREENFVGGEEGKILYGGASEEATSPFRLCLWEPSVVSFLSLGMERDGPTLFVWHQRRIFTRLRLVFSVLDSGFHSPKNGCPLSIDDSPILCLLCASGYIWIRQDFTIENFYSVLMTLPLLEAHYSGSVGSQMYPSVVGF